MSRSKRSSSRGKSVDKTIVLIFSNGVLLWKSWIAKEVENERDL